jgi:hypothetical protein
MNANSFLTAYPALLRRYAGAIPIGIALFVILASCRIAGEYLLKATATADWIGLLVALPAIVGLVVLADATWSKSAAHQSIRENLQ